MRELEIGVNAWKHRYESAPLTKHPGIWIAHYGEKLLGEVWHPPVPNETDLVLYLGSPYSIVDEISDTFIVVDRPNQAWVSRLSWNGRGTTITDWNLPYLVTDSFEVVFSIAEKRPHPHRGLARAMDAIADHRPRAAKYDFETAFWYALERGKELVVQQH